jgi:hypothetical protein
MRCSWGNPLFQSALLRSPTKCRPPQRCYLQMVMTRGRRPAAHVHVSAYASKVTPFKGEIRANTNSLPTGAAKVRKRRGEFQNRLGSFEYGQGQGLTLPSPFRSPAELTTTQLCSAHLNLSRKAVSVPHGSDDASSYARDFILVIRKPRDCMCKMWTFGPVSEWVSEWARGFGGRGLS